MSNGQTTKFVYDGQDEVRDIQQDGTTTDYLNGLGVDEKLRQTSVAGVFYYTTDRLGSTTALTDAAGNVVERISYDAFGNSTESARTRYTYTGREWDGDANLFYYRARWYDAQAGRFISEDPVGFAGGVNWYVYVLNNPIKFKDPSGLIPDISLVVRWFDPSDPGGWVSNAGWAAQGRHFPNDADPYGGAYRHCVSACLLRRRYAGLGNLMVTIWDLWHEDADDENSRSDMEGEKYGLSCDNDSDSCETRCLKRYPAIGGRGQ